MRSTESSKRLLLRDTAHTLTQIIETGINCSNFEATIISQKAQEVYQLGEYNTDNVLQPGQMVWKAISATEPAGKPLDQCEFKRIILTVHNIDEDKDKIVEMYIKGNDAVTIARNMKHSLKAVERYIHTFCRVLYCQKQLHNSLNTAMVVWKEN